MNFFWFNPFIYFLLNVFDVKLTEQYRETQQQYIE